MKRFLGLVLVFLYVLTSFIPAKECLGAGFTDLNLNPVSDAGETSYYTSTWATWSTQCQLSTPNISDAYGIGWQNRSTGSTEWNIYWYAVTFDIATLPATADVKSITLKLYVSGQNDTYAWDQFYAIYAGYPTTESNLISADGRRWWYGTTVKRISNVVSHTALTIPGWVEFSIADLKTGDFNYVLNDTNKLVTFYFMTTNQALFYAPPWPGAGTYSKIINIHGYDDASNKPILDIKYVANATAVTFTGDDNAPIDTTTDGSEKVTSIDWVTPRLQYSSDPSMRFKVNGDSGANFTGKVINNAGVTLATIDDSVRTDGNYDWKILDISAYSGFVRAEAITDNTTNTIRSKWGYVSASPSTAERTGDIYSGTTDFPQYDNSFGSYVVQAGSNMFVHWKTNINGATELTKYRVVLRKNGDANGAVYNQLLSDMQTGYYEGSLANSQTSLHWRYAIFTPNTTGQGYNNRDGLIISLNLPLIPGNKGFYQPLILDNADNTTLITETQSAYWYLSNANEGITMNMDRTSYATGNDVTVKVNIGQAGQVATYLRDFGTALVGGTGSYDNGGTLLVGMNNFIVKGIPDGTYDMRLSFSGPNVSNFTYIHDIPFQVMASTDGGDSVLPPGTVTGVWDLFKAWMASYGFDNPVGHWLVLIILMVIMFLLFHKSELLRVVMPLMIFAVGFVSEWVDRWWIVLLALGAGLTLFGILRNKIAGNRGGE